MNSHNMIPENHRRSLSVTAKMIEESLDDVESKLRGNYNNKITQIIEQSYDSETKEKIFEIIGEIKAVNAEMFGNLYLTPQKTFESRLLQAQTVYLWSILIDSTSNNLIRYGNLSTEECTMIDNYILKLLKLLEKLKTIGS